MDDDKTVVAIGVAALLAILWLCAALGAYERTRGWAGWEVERELPPETQPREWRD